MEGVSKLSAEHDKKINDLEPYADMLERRAAPRFCTDEDGRPMFFYHRSLADSNINHST